MKLEDKELKDVSGGIRIRDNNHTIATGILRICGDKAWALLGNYNHLWACINKAQMNDSSEKSERIGHISDALGELENHHDLSDYGWFFEQLNEALELTKNQ